MKGMNHSLKLLTDNTLDDFMVKKPLLERGTAGVVGGQDLDPLQDRPLLTMAAHH